MIVTQIAATVSQLDYINGLREENQWKLEKAETYFTVQEQDIAYWAENEARAAVRADAEYKAAAQAMRAISDRESDEYKAARAALRQIERDIKETIKARVTKEAPDKRAAAKARFIEAMTRDLDGITKAEASEIINTLKGSR